MDAIENNWSQYIDEALGRARGNLKIPVPGAKLRQILSQIVSAHGINLTEYLGTRSMSFAQLIEEQIAKGIGLVLIRRPGTDLLVAKSGEEVPSNVLHKQRGPDSNIIRSDIYQALIDFSSGQKYLYDIEKDQVLSIKASDTIPQEGNLIELPIASLEEQLELRLKFAEKFPQLGFKPKGQIKDLEFFQYRAHQLGVSRQWHEFKCESLKSRIITWASSNRLTIRNEWFGDATFRQQQEIGMANLLKHVVDYMTEEELNEIKLPLRAVHALWIFNSRRKG